MPRIRCHYLDCVFLEGGYCTAARVELDPDVGCLAYRIEGELSEDEDDIVFEEELLDEWEREADDLLEDDDELWDGF